MSKRVLNFLLLIALIFSMLLLVTSYTVVQAQGGEGTDGDEDPPGHCEPGVHEQFFGCGEGGCFSVQRLKVFITTDQNCNTTTSYSCIADPSCY